MIEGGELAGDGGFLLAQATLHIDAEHGEARAPVDGEQAGDVAPWT